MGFLGYSLIADAGFLAMNVKLCVEDYSLDCTYNCVNNYCASNSTHSSDGEHIYAIEIGDFSNVSGDNGGYKDFTFLNTLELAKASSHIIYLTPGTDLAKPANEAWRIWIDF